MVNKDLLETLTPNQWAVYNAINEASPQISATEIVIAIGLGTVNKKTDGTYVSSIVHAIRKKLGVTAVMNRRGLGFYTLKDRKPDRPPDDMTLEEYHHYRDTGALPKHMEADGQLSVIVNEEQLREVVNVGESPVSRGKIVLGTPVVIDNEISLEEYQALVAKSTSNKHKYRVAPEPDRTYKGVVFHSKKEMERFIVLEDMQNCGEILTLTTQPKFLLQEKFFDNRTGKAIRKVEVIFDFMYFVKTKNGKWRKKPVLEDTKGFPTEVFKLKKKLFLFQYQGKYELVIT